MHLIKQLLSIFARRSSQLICAARVERQIWRNVVHSALVTAPCRPALSPVVLLEHRGCDAHERRHPGEISPGLLESRPVQRTVARTEEDLLARGICVAVRGKLEGVVVGWR